MNKHKKGLALWIAAVLMLLAGALLAGAHDRSGGVQEAMQGAVLHDVNQISLFGLTSVNPHLISAFVVSALLLLAALLIRLFVIPRFKLRPGKFQLALEGAVGLFDGKARGSRPHRYRFTRAYIFAAGVFIFAGILYGLLGLQAITVNGRPVALPTPLFNVNTAIAIAIGPLSFLVIASGGVAANGLKGILKALKKFSLRKTWEFIKKKGCLMKEHKKGLIVWITAVIVLLAGSILAGTHVRSESVQEAMRDAVLHDVNQISLFGLKPVNPGLISAFVVSALLLLAALLIRLFVIPRFKLRPGKFQLALEEAVGLFDGMARGSSPHRYRFMGAYIFAAGAFIFVSTLFELLGLQAITVNGHPVTLPAPLSDVNAAIATGTLSYLVIASGGVAANGPKGILKALKEFSLPISMSFRLFGALLSGLLVTELVYYYVNLSFVLPVVVGVLFTLLHALIQTYVLTMLVSLYYGEVSEPSPKKAKAKTKG